MLSAMGRLEPVSMPDHSSWARVAAAQSPPPTPARTRQGASSTPSLPAGRQAAWRRTGPPAGHAARAGGLRRVAPPPSPAHRLLLVHLGPPGQQEAEGRPAAAVPSVKRGAVRKGGAPILSTSSPAVQIPTARAKRAYATSVTAVWGWNRVGRLGMGPPRGRTA